MTGSVAIIEILETHKSKLQNPYTDRAIVPHPFHEMKEWVDSERSCSFLHRPPEPSSSSVPLAEEGSNSRSFLVLQTPD